MLTEEKVEVLRSCLQSQAEKVLHTQKSHDAELLDINMNLFYNIIYFEENNKYFHL